MKNIFNKLLFAFFITFSMVLVWGKQPPMPMENGKAGDGTGAPKSPIDGELWILIFIAIIFVVAFAMKFRRAQIQD